MKEFDLEHVKGHWEEAQAGKLLRTWDGKPVRLLCLDAKHVYPIIGLIQQPSGKETIETWKINGRYREDNNTDPLDLVIKTTKYEGWMNIYQGEGLDLPYGGTIHDTEESALDAKSKKAITTVKIEWEE